MEKIAHKTEEETISMHIITLVALIFLPGTFIAVRLFVSSSASQVRFLTSSTQTVFQSGVFQWGSLDMINGASWVFKKDVFLLFAGVSAVIMAITFSAWFLLYRCLRRRSRRGLESQQCDEKDASQMV